MARLFGRILSSIWDDADFLALDDGEQRMYAFLLSQKNLNHAGLLQLTLGKWARKARNSSRERLVAQLQALDAARFIVLDFETEEVLVRTLVRNDSVYKQPRVMGAMVSDAREIESLRLRAALLAEVDRIPLDELNDKPGDKGGPSIRAQVAQHMADLRAAFGPMPTPPQPPRYPLGEPPLEDLAEPPYDPLYDEVPQEDSQGSTRVGASPHARALPYPVTPVAIPTPLNPTAPGALFDVEAPAVPDSAAGKPQPDADTKGSKPSKKADKPADSSSSRGTRIPADFALTEEMRAWGRKNAPHVTNPVVATDEFVDYWIALPGAKALKLDWVRTWKNRMRDLERRALERMPNQRRLQSIPNQRPSVDDRVFNTLAAAEELARDRGEIPPAYGTQPLATVTFLPVGELAS